MAFDGFTVFALGAELSEKLTGGRITKIIQPEKDELLITIKNNGTQYRLFLSASAGLPLAYLTSSNKNAPLSAPGFCMLLRKHIGGGRIISVEQPSLERILFFRIEHLDEMGDLCRKTLVIELMGKHSNIIFCKEDGTILDSIKHISSAVSSVREVLPGRPYFIPKTVEKLDPLTAPVTEMAAAVISKPLPLCKAVYTCLTGFSPAVAEELCFRAGVDPGRPGSAAPEGLIESALERLLSDLKASSYDVGIYYKNEEPVEFAVISLTMYADLEFNAFESVSQMLESFYSEKNAVTRIRQKSSDLRHVIQTSLERSRKKYGIQEKQLRDTEKMDICRVRGELLQAYGYDVPEGASSMSCTDYYTGKETVIPLDPTKNAQQNAQKYFERYGKLKRTKEAVTKLLEETKAEIAHLESIQSALDIARTEEDLVPIKEELTDYGYIRRRGPAKKTRITSKPYHYLSSDGFDIYVGKNNYQNDELTFKTASNSDWWFHAKGMPGSHVILKTDGKEPPDRAFEEAARLAAYYSKGRGNDRVEVDYLEKRHVKKPGAARPGFVVYYTNYSMVIDSDITGLKQV